MTNYAKHLRPQALGQTQKDRDDQVKNSAGGYVYGLDDWARLDRFLVLGSEGGTYYATERKLTIENAGAIQKLLNGSIEDGKRVVDRIVEISKSGRAPKNDSALFALALCLCSSNTSVRQYAVKAVPQVARIGTHLFTLVDYCDSLRGWGRGLRRAVAEWYNSLEADKLSYQVCKYQSRAMEGSQSWSHKDLLRKAHVSPATMAHDAIFRYLTKGWSDDQVNAFKASPDNPFNYIGGHELAKRAKSESEILGLIKEFNLSRESIPTEYLNSPKVWRAMLDNMPMGAMLRNLAKMTSIGLIAPLSGEASYVADRLRDEDLIQKARIHPINVLSAMKTYASGHGVRGKLTWNPSQSVVDALDDAFYKAFKTITPTGKRILLAVDCSSSMDCPVNGLPHISARDAAAAMALSIAKVESNHHIVGFTNANGYRSSYGRTNVNDGMMDLGISSRMRLDSVIQKMQQFPWGGTDCALPMLWAMKKSLKVDAFVVITDNETWAGTVKADEALRQYRKSSGIHDARLVVLGTSATAFTIADPNDPYSLDIAGFDSSAPQIVTDFIAGRI